MNKLAKKPKLLTSRPINSSLNSWEKIQELIEQETIKENLISIQEEMENNFLEAVEFNWPQMNPTEKKLAIQIGCLVQSLREDLQKTLAKNYH